MAQRSRRGRGEGGVFFDKDRGLWVGSVSLGYHPDGRRNRPVVYRKHKREVLEEIERLKRTSGKGGKTTAAPTISELLDSWLEDRRPHVALLTHEGREDAIGTVKESALASLPASDLTPLIVSRFYAEARKAGMARSTLWHAARALSGCLAYAVKLGVLAANPVDAAGLPAMKHKEMTALSQPQARALLEASRGLVSHTLIAVALGSGLRQGELLGLSWSDVDLAAGRLTVRQALTRTRSSGFVLKVPKTKAARRTIALPDFAAEALHQHHESRRAKDMLRLTVFCSERGAHRYSATLFAYLKRAVKRANAAGAGIPDTFHWHSLRHSHASLLLSAGHSLRAVSQRLGHASPAFTLKWYAQCLPADDDRLAEGIQGILG